MGGPPGDIGSCRRSALGGLGEEVVETGDSNESFDDAKHPATGAELVVRARRGRPVPAAAVDPATGDVADASA